MRGSMDVYYAWFNLKEDVPDLQFAEAARAYLERLKEEGQLVAYRITRCKLGLAPPNLREWHITLDFLGLNQLDQAFLAVSERADPIESFHQAVNSKVRDIFFALYRDFPTRIASRGRRSFRADKQPRGVEAGGSIGVVQVTAVGASRPLPRAQATVSFPIT